MCNLERPRGRPRRHWSDYISHLVWEHLGIPYEELEDVAGERDIWATLGSGYTQSELVCTTRCPTKI